MSSVYASTIITSKKTDEVRLTVDNGNVKEFKIDPPQDNDPSGCRSPKRISTACSTR